MKKTLLLAFSLIVSLALSAQDNLALNKQAYASSVSDENAELTADKAVDGNTGTKWASNYGTKDATMTDEQKAAQWFYVDLGAIVSVNTVKITWDNQAAHQFDIRYATTDPSADPKTAGTVALSAQSGTDNTQDVYKFDEAVEARYIILDLQERGPWGYGIAELEVYAIDYDAAKLTTVTVSPAIFKAGEATELTLSAIDNFNNAMTGITYTVGDVALANPFTASVSGKITITGKDAKGNTATADVYAMGEADAPADPTDVFVAVYTKDVAATWESVYNGGAKAFPEITLGDSKVRPYGDTQCVFFTNPDKWGDIYNVNINPTASQYAQLHVSVFSPVDATGRVVLEQTKKIDDSHAFTVEAGKWTDVAIDLDGETFIKAMSVRMDAGEPVALANIYFTKAEENPDAGKIVALTVAPEIVAADVATELILTAIDNKGVEITEGVTYTAMGLADGVLTSAAGVVTITGSTNSGAETATASVYVVAAPERTNTDDDIEILQSGKSATGSGTDWEGGYTALANLVYSDASEAYHAKNVKTLYLTNPGLTAEDLDGFKTLHLDVFSIVDDAEASVVLEGIGATASFVAKKGEWVSVEVPFEGGSVASSWIKIKFTADAVEAVVDNVYFSKEQAKVPFNITITDGIAKVTGDVKADDIEAINNADAMWIDMMGITFLEEGAAAAIAPKHQNALVRVPGSVEDNVAVIDANYTELAAVKNAVVATEWIFPLAQLQIVDDGTEPVWNGEGGVNTFISTGERGYKITRTLPEGEYTTAAPANAVALPEGVEVYELTAYTEANGVTMRKVLEETFTLAAKTPYMLYAAEAVDLVVEGTGDLNLREGAESKTIGEVAFVPNLASIEAADMFALSADGTAFEAITGNVAPFRAYFTGVTAETTVTLDDGISYQTPDIAAAPEPTVDADYVIGIYTDAYETADGIGFRNFHNVDVTAEEIAASDNADDKIYRIYTNKGFNYYGMQLDKAYDLSTLKSIHVDIWSSDDATIGFSPVNQATEPHTAKKELTLTAGWNHFDIAITDYSGMDVTNVDQLEFFDAPADIVIGIDNIYFESETVITGIRLQRVDGDDAAYYTLGGQRVDRPTSKGIYIHNGRKVIVK